MSYFGFLALFLGAPLSLLGVLLWQRRKQGRLELPSALRGAPAGWVIVGHVLAAILYTTPWDNYLVATGVWWYNPSRVSGVILGWVPIEEYTFFVLQSVLAGLWIVFLAGSMSRANPTKLQAPMGERRLFGGVQRVLIILFYGLIGLLWLTAMASLIMKKQPVTYLALIVAWAIPPMLIQLSFGGAILWQNRRLVGWALATTTLYLSAVDGLAIAAKVWTIDPIQSMKIVLFGVLPVEELVFFAATNSLLIFGIVLVLSSQSHSRVREWSQRGLG